MRSKAEEYRQNALKCAAVAELVTDPATKIALLRMAQAWERLADQAARNSTADLVYETPAPRAPQRPAIQQQQQVQPKKD